ncbi:ParA family protein [Burkholderia gladioli]|uniref:ParA family protein n=1 Tax=Burkholderia gladioli TaxID=28095 RepID=UPI0016407B28|nr:ParA family protein [Burkholderia gladioli]
MSSYAFWNNKGGVGKSYLCFVAASEYAHLNPDIDVIVIDLCPQANVSETLLGGQEKGGQALRKILGGNSRLSVGGYLEQRLNSPFYQIADAAKYATQVSLHNDKVPKNLHLVCGDNLVEVLAEAIRQTSQLSVPIDSWKKVIYWIKDLKDSIRESRQRECVFFFDCNPSFAVYTQLAVSASEYLVVPFTADESSRRGIENIIALLYGQGDEYIASFARLSFFKRAKEEGINLPKLHTFISNRVMLFDGEPSKAFKAANASIRSTVDKLAKRHRTLFSPPQANIADRFVDIPDHHGASIVSSLTGTPMHKMKAGPKMINGERVQVNLDPLKNYKAALSKLVARF